MSDLALDETDDTVEEQQTGKGLRAQLEAALKAKADFESKYQEASQKVRQSQIEAQLAARGANPKIAQFIPASIGDGDEIAAWLDDNADLFTQSTPTQTSAPKPGPDQQSVDNAKRIQNLGSTPPPNSHLSDIEARIANAESADEVQALWGEASKYLL